MFLYEKCILGFFELLKCVSSQSLNLSLSSSSRLVSASKACDDLDYACFSLLLCIDFMQ